MKTIILSKNGQELVAGTDEKLIEFAKKYGLSYRAIETFQNVDTYVDQDLYVFYVNVSFPGVTYEDRITENLDYFSIPIHIELEGFMKNPHDEFLKETTIYNDDGDFEVDYTFSCDHKDMVMRRNNGYIFKIYMFAENYHDAFMDLTQRCRELAHREKVLYSPTMAFMANYRWGAELPND